jgi:hypothetical protein
VTVLVVYYSQCVQPAVRLLLTMLQPVHPVTANALASRAHRGVHCLAATKASSLTIRRKRAICYGPLSRLPSPFSGAGIRMCLFSGGASLEMRTAFRSCRATATHVCHLGSS